MSVRHVTAYDDDPEGGVQYISPGTYISYFSKVPPVTDLPVEAKTVAELIRTGRLRWKIENEGFNTQKNLGYRLAHKYSRCSWRAGKNYYQCLQIAHLINQLAELSEQAKRLLSGKKTLKHLWKCLFSLLLEGSIAQADIRFLETLRSTMRYE
jgi:hypothetical protein